MEHCAKNRFSDWNLHTCQSGYSFSRHLYARTPRGTTAHGNGVLSTLATQSPTDLQLLGTFSSLNLLAEYKLARDFPGSKVKVDVWRFAAGE
jgi:hypothetical protein